MTGPEHYQEAEKLLSDEYRGDGTALQRAMVHAVLALAAATALGGHAPWEVFASGSSGALSELHKDFADALREGKPDFKGPQRTT